LRRAKGPAATNGKISAALLVHSPEPKLYHNLRIDNSDDPVGDLRDAFELGKETERDLSASTDEMLGEYPEEILDFGLKYQHTMSNKNTFNPTDIDRRRFLKASGLASTAGMAAFAGCSGQRR